jgi:protein-disulfide isomerase
VSDPYYPRDVVDDDFDVFGVEQAAARLAERIEAVQLGAARLADDARPLLSPPFELGHDRVEVPASAPTTLVVFGAYATPWSRSLGNVLASIHQRHPGTVSVAWRHYPDPAAHPRALIFALAAEAAAANGRFWALTRELLQLRHNDPADLHAAMLRASLDPTSMIQAMRAGTGGDRIVADVASALVSGVTAAPALFVDGERYEGELKPAAVSAALARA